MREYSPLVGTLTPCRKCGVPKYRSAFAKGKVTCRDCRNQRTEAERRALAAREKAWREQRKAERMAATQANRPQRFEQSVAMLERLWGALYATWTREQHATHSRLLRETAGVPEDVAPGARKVAA